MNKKEVIFKYKGDRSYIHGTDMFNLFLSQCVVKERGKIKFSVHAFIKQARCDLYRSHVKEDIDHIEGLASRCQLEVDGDMLFMGLKPSEKQDENIGRYAYDESLLVDMCALSQESIRLSSQSPFSFIETVVAMKKKLMETMFPDVDGKWVFTRIDLPEYCNATSDISIEFKHNMNFRLLKSDILVHGEKVGDLYFSLVKS